MTASSRRRSMRRRRSTPRRKRVAAVRPVRSNEPFCAWTVTRPSPALHGRLALRLFRACARGRLFARHAEFGERLIVELAARWNRPRELKLSERSLRLGAEIAVDRSCVEAEREQP